MTAPVDPVPAESGSSSAADDWDEHWRRYESANTENPANDYRRHVAFKMLAAGGDPVRLLDIGAGQGDLLAAARDRWPRVELGGVELSTEGVALAGHKVPGARLHQRNLLHAAAVPEDLQAWATHAVCSEVLEHVEDPALLLRNASAYLAPGCRVVITVPGGPMSAFDHHIGHRMHYTADQLAGVVRAAGLEVDRVLRAGFPFFNAYRRIVILRGDKLIDEFDTSDGAPMGAAARIALGTFGVLFRLNRDDTRFGTQIVGVARVPA